MSSIGTVGGTTPVVPADDTTTTTTTTTTDGSGGASTISRQPTSTRPLVGAGPDTDLDGISDSLEIRLGLDPNAARTEHTIGARDAWEIPGSGYAAFGDDAVTVAVHKYANLFDSKEARIEAGAAYWEMFSAGTTKVPAGTWLPPTGSVIQESDFENTAGVNVWGDKLIGDVAYGLMREAAAPRDAVFALRNSRGHRLAARSSDKVVPTYVDDAGKIREARLQGADRWGGSSYVDAQSGKAVTDVVWRLQTSGGTIRGSKNDKQESREELLGIEEGRRFDFIDAMGNPISMDKSRGDLVAATWKDGDAIVALRPRHDSNGRVNGYTRYDYDAEGKVSGTKRISRNAGDKLVAEKGDDVLFRVQTSAGQLKGDGEIKGEYNQSWWGRCQNTATIDQSNIPQPNRDVRVVSNHEPAKGEELALSWQAGSERHVLVPKRDADGKVEGYDHQVRNARGRVTSSSEVSVDEAKRLGADATPVIVKADGGLKEAVYETITTEDATMLTALMGNGATDYHGSVGNRYWGYPDQVQVDGRNVQGKIVSVETEGGKSIDIVRRSGTEWKDVNGGVLRGEDFKADTRYAGSRAVAWTSTSMESINARRPGNEAIKTVVFEHADGRRESFDAAKIGSIGRENLYDMTPAQIWKSSSEWIKDGKSFTAEVAPGEQVWNYGVKTTSAERLDTLPAHLREQNALPGAMAGTVGDEGKLYFKTVLDTVGGRKELISWVKLDAQGELKDFNWLSGDPPDFFWRSHVKDSFESTWTGEGNVGGTNMTEIQRLYNATIGGYEAYAVGDVLSTAEMARRTPVRPEAPQ